MIPRKEYTHLNNIVRSVNRRTGAHLSVKDARRIAKRNLILVEERKFNSGTYPCVERELVPIIEAYLLNEAKKQKNGDQQLFPAENTAQECTAPSIVFDTILGNRACVFLREIVEMVYYPTEVVLIMTQRQQYWAIMTREGFDHILELRKR